MLWAGRDSKWIRKDPDMFLVVYHQLFNEALLIVYFRW